MKVTITYYDDKSLTVDEVLKRAKDNYGEYIDVDVQPTSNSPLDIIYFGLQQLVTHEQLSILFDNSSTETIYKQNLLKLKTEIMASIEKELSLVMRDNEQKIL